MTCNQCSPPAFDRVVGLDWYDGITSGILVCDACSETNTTFSLLTGTRTRTFVFLHCIALPAEQLTG